MVVGRVTFFLRGEPSTSRLGGIGAVQADTFILPIWIALLVHGRV
jgi:hypothetical protein